MKLNRKLVMVLALVLSVAMATSGTMAYLSDEDSDVNVMTLGSVKIEQNEQERENYTDQVNPETLIDFTQGRPLYPAVYGDDFVAASGDWGVLPTNQNVVDKFVTVTNTGKSDAYVRTIIAYEDNIFTEDNIDKEYVHIVDNSSNTAEIAVEQLAGIYEIDGANYRVYVYTYNKALAPDATTIPSLKQVYMDKAADNEHVERYGDTYEILVLSQAVQAQGFNDAATALNAGFPGIDVKETVIGWLEGISSENIGGSDDFEGALGSDDEAIIINLTSDVTYDVAAWANEAMGGQNTEKIVINGNGHTITFEHTNSDWNNIVTNGATLKISNAHITNSGNNNGPWNRHDLNFGCNVELFNVTSDKALAFKAGAVLKNVTINDKNTSDTYAIWIQPNGQTVTLDGCTIDMLDCTDGRGIKIDEQYVSDPEKVTLNVKNTTFKTEEKAAIIVKSAAGADINLENVNISKVAEDKSNAVWVDEDSASNADKVKVTGGTKVIEPTIVTKADKLVEALEKGEDVNFTTDIKIDPAGMSNAYGTTGINVKNGQTINGNGHTLDIKGAGGTWDSGINTTGGLIKDLTVTGSFRGIFINHNSSHSERVVLENVTIEGTTYTISCDQGLNQGLTATNSTFKGWTSYAKTLGDAKFVDCYFGEGNGYSYCRPYAPTEFVGCEFETGFTVEPVAAVTFEDCTLNGVALTADNIDDLVTDTAKATVK